MRVFHVFCYWLAVDGGDRMTRMKRDLDLYIKLLRHFESLASGDFVISMNHQNFDCTAHELVEHLELLIEQGLLKGEAEVIPHDSEGGDFLIKRVTCAGHDFLQLTRDEELWGDTKRIMKKAGTWTFGILLELLKENATGFVKAVIKSNH
jgi:Hypothetical protein (DUF2513)